LKTKKEALEEKRAPEIRIPINEEWVLTGYYFSRLKFKSFIPRIIRV